MEYPVYLFAGFLEAGKTKFLQETLADKNFFDRGNERTLVILCEEGEEELDPEGFISKNVFVEVIDEQRRLNPDKLSALAGKYRPERVLMEYNGMWLITDLINALPQDWYICQQMTFFDASTVDVYNANMRNLVVDKINNADLVVFNRCEPDEDIQKLHKLVRGVTRRADIFYERTNGQAAYDDIEDPLPFDVNAPVIKVEERDYALLYRDLAENMPQYDGKTVNFSGMVSKYDRLPKGGFIIGRPIMTCCAADIAFSGLFCETGAELVQNEQWVNITAKIRVKPCRVYGRKGPVLTLIDVKPAAAPEDPVATFY
ncbi:MAG: GTPase [Clostridia bacterium]|nr:GTPase [Clostridia bacterium]